MINEIEKTFFNPGDVVTLKHSDLTSPVMYVVEKITQSYKHGNEITAVGCQSGESWVIKVE